MLKNNFSEDKHAWFIFLNGNDGGGHKGKIVEREMKNDDENTRIKD